MTSPRLKGEGSAGDVCAAAAVDQVVTHTVNRRATRRHVRLFMTSSRSCASRRAGTHCRPGQAASVVSAQHSQATYASPLRLSLPWPTRATAWLDGHEVGPPTPSSYLGMSERA